MSPQTLERLWRVKQLRSWVTALQELLGDHTPPFVTGRCGEHAAGRGCGDTPIGIGLCIVEIEAVVSKFDEPETSTNV
jgi:hypothetical protein